MVYKGGATLFMPQNTKLRWLHFSDLHVGMNHQNQLWPRFSTAFKNDLKSQLERVGGVDFIIFSGDLVHKGSSEEFNRLDEVLAEILECFKDGLAQPKVITTPGNHDLLRPSPLRPEVEALMQFWGREELREGFWTDAGLVYREFIADIFRNYTHWRDRAIAQGIHHAPKVEGELPGDASYVVETPAGHVGVACLNGAWLQLRAENYSGQLHIDARQIIKITGGNPDQWAAGHVANLLVTHHPSSWFHRNLPSTWENDINPSGRFDAHLFGHMHEPDASSIRHGGGHSRLNIQASSLFGLEHYGDSFERIQGYSMAQIDIGKAERKLTSWPRRLIFTTGGIGKLVRDTAQDLDEDTGSFSISYAVDHSLSRTVTALGANSRSQSSSLSTELSPRSTFDLSVIRSATSASKAHANVRRVEQETLVQGLQSDRVVWLSADWGLGHDGFLGSVRGSLKVPLEQVYRLDFSDFQTRSSFFDALQTRFNATFQQIGESLSDAGPAIMILDDIDVNSAQAPQVEFEVEQLAMALADFAGQAFVVIRSRRRPRNAQFQIVELAPLDEADLAIYVSESEIGGSQFGKPNAASKLYRHTDGVPARIDDALRDLEIVSMKDLIAANPDFGATGGLQAGVPEALATSVQELRISKDRLEQRAFELLLALSALPQGEQLARLKRFLGVHPIGPLHARVLAERALVDTIGLTSLDASDDGTGKALIVPRPVRDYVREIVEADLIRETDRKILSLYFGENWSSGEIRKTSTCKRVRAALCDGYEIQNASTLVVRTVRGAFHNDNSIEIDGSIRLASSFIEILIEGAHFRAAAGLCEDMIDVLDGVESQEKCRTIFKYEYGRSLRMINRTEEARDVLLGLDTSYLTKSQSQQSALCLALCYESLGAMADASETAKRAIVIDRRTNSALQAKVIIAEQISDNEEREAELRKFLRTAEKKQASILVSNIRIELTRVKRRRGEDVSNSLREIAFSSYKSGDFYNSARAIIDLASLPNAEDVLTIDERERLIEAYHFLYNERLFNLFDRCHDALWRVFEASGDTENLLNLFRRSSFIWRLNGRDAQESKYLSKLMGMAQEIIAIGISKANRDGAYFIVRVTVITGKAISELSQSKQVAKDSLA